MSARDRSITLVLVVAALIAWLGVVIIVLTVAPVGDAGAQLLGAISLGTAVALTAWPLLWSMRRGSPGSLVTAGRRAGLAGLVVSILVVLRVLDAVSLPLVLFLVVGAALVEVAFTLRR
ncbi:MAG TPA: hypothetical protein VFF55_11865 [Candidatus Deferrimicrobium sp.]|nr:hypothetical protein [Candidatus Deferrimicrobium sp.]